jgi:hypothetical protein
LPQGIAVAREKDIEQPLFMDLQQLTGHYENSCGGSRLEKEWQRKSALHGKELESLGKELLAQPPEVIHRMKRILEK